MMDGWTAVEVEIARIVAESGKPFDPATIAHINDFLAHVRGRCPIPEVAKGYWSTICFSWEGIFDIEIFSDRFEIYRFFDRRIDIRHFAHVAGEPFPPEVMAELRIVPESK
jgi:hypothetical protein